jgi:hypothetical protein
MPAASFVGYQQVRSVTISVSMPPLPWYHLSSFLIALVSVLRRLAPSSYSRTTGQWEQEAMALLNSGDRLAVLQLPGPSSGVVRCYVKRVSNLLGMGQNFELRLECTDDCLAIARRRVKSATSSYVIGLAGSSCSSGSSTPSSHGHHEGSSSPSAASLRRDDPEVVGKVSPRLGHNQHCC